MKSRSIIGSFILILAILFCLFFMAVAWLFIDLPKRAQNIFGPPAPGIGFFERIDLSARLLLKNDALNSPAVPPGNDPAGQIKMLFKIESGESTYAITTRLQQAGLISQSQPLRDYLTYSGLDTTIQAGEFELNPHMTIIEIAWALQDATPNEVVFRILPGWRLEEIAEALPTSGLEFSSEDFLSFTLQPPANLSISPSLPAGASLEGFLFPDRYRLPRKIGLTAFIDTVLLNFQIKVDPQIQQGFEQQGLSLFQAITLASIIQREAVVEDEMPLIASVFLNRLSQGMKLETDPTVQYALGYHYEDQSNPAGSTWWKNPLSLDDLQVQNPYNTYLAPGLPPGPIASPGLSALRAVAFPAKSPYYYFRSACDNSGRHNFAETFEQHQQNACPE